MNALIIIVEMELIIFLIIALKHANNIKELKGITGFSDTKNVENYIKNNKELVQDIEVNKHTNSSNKIGITTIKELNCIKHDVNLDGVPVEYLKIRTILKLKGYETTREDEIMLLALEIAKKEANELKRFGNFNYKSEKVILLKLTKDLYTHMVNLEKNLHKDKFYKQADINNRLNLMVDNFKNHLNNM